MQTRNIPRDGGEALYQRWSKRLWAENRWVKYYWLYILAFVNLFLCFFVVNEWDRQHLHSSNPGLDIWIIVTVISLIITRVQVSATPALLAFHEFELATLTSLRATSIKTLEILFAMFRHAFLGSILPVAVLTTISIILADNSIRFHQYYGGANLHLYWLVFILSMFMSLSLAALGYIGILISRKPFGSTIGLLSPLFFLAFINVVYLLNFNQNEVIFNILECEIMDRIRITTLILFIPEPIILRAIRDDFFQGNYSDNLSFLTISLIMGVLTILLWALLYWVLKRIRA
ncbi:hypothetical protein KAU08_05590 [bacterium]|nr:hypothetical protein [bacterium]